MDQTPNSQIINYVLEKHFAFWATRGDYAFSHISELVPQSMKDLSKEDDDEGYSFWIPIKSTTSIYELDELEHFFGTHLPQSYKSFLCQFHFIELHLGNTVSFFSHKPGELLSVFKKEIDTFYPNLIERGYLPFANFNDWGVVCFNINATSISNNYEIVVLDHDDGYERATKLSNDFIDLFSQFNTELDKKITQITNKI